MLGVGCGACERPTALFWDGSKLLREQFLPLSGRVNQLPHYFPHSAGVVAFRSGPGAIAWAHALALPFGMLTAFIERHQTAKIVFAQTTYMHLEVEEGAFRVDFKDKAAFCLKLGTRGLLSHHTNHPLLLNHNEPRTTLYINSQPENPQALFADIEATVDAIYQDWYDWRSLLFQFGRRKEAAVALVKQNIAQGSGILFEYAPATVLLAVISVCNRHGVATRYFGSLDWNSLPHEAYSVLLIGSCYAVARGFQIRIL